MTEEYREILDKVKLILNMEMRRIAHKEGIDWDNAKEGRVDEAVEKMADAVIEKLDCDYRSVSEVQQIVDMVKSGRDVQIAHQDPDDEDEYIYRPCW